MIARFKELKQPTPSLEEEKKKHPTPDLTSSLFSSRSTDVMRTTRNDSWFGIKVPVLVAAIQLSESLFGVEVSDAVSSTLTKIHQTLLAKIDAYSCGDWSYPIPNFTPAHNPYKSSNPQQSLYDYGFHNTAPGSACGQPAYYITCTNDFTRARSNISSTRGTCDSPLFRDHGHIEKTAYGDYWIQFSEPNPEVYVAPFWPYWNWPSYVQYWHSVY